jgi:uncharacterized protein (UPF0276 family)
MASGLSLGSTDPLDRPHLDKLATLIRRVEPALVSEHLCWSGVAGLHFNDLLPLPFTGRGARPRLHRASQRSRIISGGRSQSRTSRRTSAFDDSTMPEWEFVAAVVRRTGCKLLLDVNNVYVNAVNHGFDADGYLAAMPREAIAESTSPGSTRPAPVSSTRTARAWRPRSGRSIAGRLRGSDRAPRSSNGTSTSPSSRCSKPKPRRRAAILADRHAVAA